MRIIQNVDNVTLNTEIKGTALKRINCGGLAFSFHYTISLVQWVNR
jgi:hypothetical protein